MSNWIVRNKATLEILGSVLTNRSMTDEEIIDLASVEIAQTEEDYEDGEKPTYEEIKIIERDSINPEEYASLMLKELGEPVKNLDGKAYYVYIFTEEELKSEMRRRFSFADTMTEQDIEEYIDERVKSCNLTSYGYVEFIN